MHLDRSSFRGGPDLGENGARLRYPTVVAVLLQCSHCSAREAFRFRVSAAIDHAWILAARKDYVVTPHRARHWREICQQAHTARRRTGGGNDS
jgi:hypothetical protein